MTTPCSAHGVKAEIGRSVAVVGEAADADRAIAVILQTQPCGVAGCPPGGGGVEVIRKVHEKNPDQKFLALSVSDAAEDVIGVIRAGARGYDEIDQRQRADRCHPSSRRG